jgi:recombinational DNA repair ATPase RecF
MTDVVSLEIRGLNGREVPLSYSLDRHVNVFFGPNGSGKTSILKILHSAMADEPALLSNLSLSSANVKIHSVTHQTVFSHNYIKSQKSPSTKAPI